jgi:hypothetical protein
LALNVFFQQASKFRVLFSSVNDSEFPSHADELPFFLNRIRDPLRNGAVLIPISSIDEIKYGLESNPELTLQGRTIRARMLVLFKKLSLR